MLNKNWYIWRSLSLEVKKCNLAENVQRLIGLARASNSCFILEILEKKTFSNIDVSNNIC